MAIEFNCGHCNRILKLKDKCAGLTGECPYCKGVITVPAVVPTSPPPPADIIVDGEPAKDFKPPTEKQLDYARNLGINVPDGIDRRQLSQLIDDAKDNLPATEKQKQFLRELGVSFSEDIRTNQISMLIDAAIDIRDQVQHAVQTQFEQQMKDAGQLMEHATVEQLLQELSNREKPCVMLVLDNDEFRYEENVPMSGQLLWNDFLSKEDVQYIVSVLMVGWAKDFDMRAYSDEFDGTPPSLKLSAGPVEREADNVVRVSLDGLFESENSG